MVREVDQTILLLLHFSYSKFEWMLWLNKWANRYIHFLSLVEEFCRIWQIFSNSLSLDLWNRTKLIGWMNMMCLLYLLRIAKDMDMLFRKMHSCCCLGLCSPLWIYINIEAWQLSEHLIILFDANQPFWIAEKRFYWAMMLCTSE